MILFFDRSVGITIPQTLADYLKPYGVTVEYHQSHFEMDEDDDVWLPKVGEWGWTVVGQDHNYHNDSPELAAIKTYSVGAFYLWGAEERKWETLRCFARGYDNIMHRIEQNDPPYIFRVEKHGGTHEIFV